MIRWLILLLAFGCGVRVIQFVNDKARFDKFNTYTLLSMKGQNVGEQADPSGLLQRIEGQIHEEMSRRGYKTSNNPDLVLRYEVVASTKTERTNDNYFYGPIYTPSLRTINESVILLEMTDFRSKKLVWQASLDLREHNRVTKKKDKLKAAIVRIFNTYLYRAGQSSPDETLIVK